jgi:hypothetical protein
MIATDGKRLLSTNSDEELRSYARRLGIPDGSYVANRGRGYYKVSDLLVNRLVLSAGAYKITPGKLDAVAWWSKPKPKETT